MALALLSRIGDKLYNLDDRVEALEIAKHAHLGARGGLIRGPGPVGDSIGMTIHNSHPAPPFGRYGRP